MTKTALDANANPGSDEFEKAMLTMTAGEKDMFQKMQAK